MRLNSSLAEFSSLTVTQQLDWRGLMSGSGSVTLAAGATGTMGVGGGVTTLDTLTFNNKGTMTV
jgi:hypothetical protein